MDGVYAKIRSGAWLCASELNKIRLTLTVPPTNFESGLSLRDYQPVGVIQIQGTRYLVFENEQGGIRAGLSLPLNN